MANYLEETSLLNFSDFHIQQLVNDKNWKLLDEKKRILAIYNYVRDSIPFGYNQTDGICASQVLIDGYGQCNTKAILFMALLRAVEIPCRIHGFTIDKKLQKGAIKGVFYQLSPQEILHSWVEVYYQGNWFNLEGFILDVPYLSNLQKKFSKHEGAFCGYGVATNDFKNPLINWDENDTYIQKEGIVQDFGIYDNPDQFFSKHRQNLTKGKEIIYKYFVRHLMNRNIAKIRQL